jgi:hypothetical protein
MEELHCLGLLVFKFAKFKKCEEKEAIEVSMGSIVLITSYAERCTFHNSTHNLPFNYLLFTAFTDTANSECLLLISSIQLPPSN